MSVHVIDDGMVRTHDDALALLRAAVPGGEVRVYPVMQPGDARSAAACRRYEIRLPRLGGYVTSDADLYHLPTAAAPLERRAKVLAETARSAP